MSIHMVDGSITMSLDTISAHIAIDGLTGLKVALLFHVKRLSRPLIPIFALSFLLNILKRGASPHSHRELRPRCYASRCKKLMSVLGERGKNINDDIEVLVAKGLPNQVQ